MKKEEFLKLLLARLIERGIPEETAEKETEHVRTYLTESGMDELDISLDEMSDGIISMLSDSADSEKETPDVIIPIIPAAEDDSESVSDELGAAIAAMDAEDCPDDMPPESAAEPDSEGIQFSELPITVEPEEAFAEEVPEAVSDQEVNETVPVQEESAAEEENAASVSADNEETALPPAVTQAENAPDPTPEEDAEIEEFIPYDKKRKMKNKDSEKRSGNEWLYVALLVVTIPIVVALILVAFVLYLGFWVALALAMIACIAILIVFVTVGAVVSLVGIVYGVVKLITGVVPVGLFEVGLGIIVGSAVMFVGILVYNFAVRFIPFGMKLLAKLFRAGFRAIKGGYQSLKGAVDSL